MFSVVVQMAALAHRFEIFFAAVLRRVVEVGDGEYNIRARVIGFEAV
jgi:hypothetical protein